MNEAARLRGKEKKKMTMATALRGGSCKPAMLLKFVNAMDGAQR
jgi:hypothetical protein